MTEQKPVPPLAAHVGCPQTVEVLGRTWTLARWTRGVWRDFLEWARPRIPDPRKVAAEFLALLPDTPDNQAVRAVIVSRALDDAQAHLSPTSPKVTALLGTDDGMVQLVRLLLRPAHGDVSEDDADDLIRALGPKRFQALVEACAGVAPAPKDDGESPASPTSTPSPAG